MELIEYRLTPSQYKELLKLSKLVEAKEAELETILEQLKVLYKKEADLQLSVTTDSSIYNSYNL